MTCCVRPVTDINAVIVSYLLTSEVVWSWSCGVVMVAWSVACQILVVGPVAKLVAALSDWR